MQTSGCSCLTSVHMNADQYIAARVSSDMKARLRTLAERLQITESGLLKQFVEVMLCTGEEGTEEIVPPRPTPDRTTRLMIRLRPDDRLLLRERAAARGMAPATYVAVLTRAHLRSLAPLPREELLALKRSVAELGGFGRNLNQIARAANVGGAVAGPGAAGVQAMLRICEGLRGHVKALLLANQRSWNQGHANDE